MATLPEPPAISLEENAQIEGEPSLTWYVDPNTHAIAGRADDAISMRQAVEVMLSVERFRWGIYTSNFGADFSSLIGQSPGYAAAELRRRIEDALSIDDRIIGVREFEYDVSGDTLSVKFTVSTVYGDIEQRMEATLT